MKIVYEIGDLLISPYQMILHGCNAQGKMGSGVAKAIRNKYPQAFFDYRDHHIKYGLNLGDVIFVKTNGKIIANGITQLLYGCDGKCYVSYEAINTVMETINRYSINNKISHVAMPLIGAGLGGGSWSIISSIIEKRCVDIIPVVYTLDGNIPT